MPRARNARYAACKGMSVDRGTFDQICSDSAFKSEGAPPCIRTVCHAKNKIADCTTMPFF